ncbi:hypothetical protein GQ602_004991 [Ophiocordyceps camponoti-floridani]|uniref:Uncharacterized protein n=1 Tax=Ophiocordyceps camponoti-floridani TaxID=2030778 RepID=A0A8H4Q4S5_9HYPO|nr:hypothetical protein GQ602_004991 [Ophiocordyceps camponoti-floridani]
MGDICLDVSSYSVRLTQYGGHSDSLSFRPVHHPGKHLTGLRSMERVAVKCSELPEQAGTLALQPDGIPRARP